MFKNILKETYRIKVNQHSFIWKLENGKDQIELIQNQYSIANNHFANQNYIWFLKKLYILKVKNTKSFIQSKLPN